MRSIVLAIIFILLLSCSAWAEVVTLKSGKVIDGEIVERTKDYIKIRCNGQEVYYENKYIKTIEGANTDASVVNTQEEKSAQDTMSSFKKGIELASAGKFDEARKEFEKQLDDVKSGLNILDAVDKGSISKEYATYLFQGSLHMMDGEYKQAIASFEQAWEINPKDPDVNYNLGSANYSLGEYQKSVAYLFATLKLQPDDTDAYELIAKAYYNTGELQKAKEYLLIAKELFKKSGDEDGAARMDGFLQAIQSQTNNHQ